MHCTNLGPVCFVDGVSTVCIGTRAIVNTIMADATNKTPITLWATDHDGIVISVVDNVVYVAIANM